eukprot:99780_1
MLLLILMLLNTQYQTNLSLLDNYEIIPASDACFSSKQYNKSTIFHAPKSGTLAGIQLLHINGTVKCSATSDDTFWGCNDNNKSPRFYTMFLKVTDSKKYIGNLYYPSHDTLNIHTILNPNIQCSHGCISGTYNMTTANALNTSNFTLIKPFYSILDTDTFMLQYLSACCPSFDTINNKDQHVHG